MKVIQTPVRFYPEIGGVENHVYYLSKELITQGIDVEVICAGNQSLPQNVQGIHVTRLPSYFKVTNTNITLSLPWVLLKKDFDIMHTHMPTPWFADWSILIAKLKRKPSILTIHNDVQKSGFVAKVITDIYLNTVFACTLALADKLILVNPDWRSSFTYTKHLLEKHQNKIVVIPNGVDTQLFKATDKKDPDKLLFVSVLDKYHMFKGIDYLLKAMQLVAKKMPRVKLEIIGEGVLKNTYEDMVKKMGIENHVSFLGSKNQKELPKYFGNASIFVLPSIHTEGYGIVLLEALSCKTPVVTTTITGLSTDIMTRKAGVVVPPKNETALANAIIRLLQSDNARTHAGSNGRKLVEEKYSWKTISKQMKNLYASL